MRLCGTPDLRGASETTPGGTCLVAQWLRIHLPMEGTQVQALVQEDPTCHGATKPCDTTTEPALLARKPQLLKPTSHNYWSPHAATTEARAPRAHALQQEKPPQ